jgi:hypothetical protein
MEWIPLCRKTVPLLKVFDDSWKALASFKDVIDALSQVDSKGITDADFVKILLDFGFTDRTAYTYEEEK